MSASGYKLSAGLLFTLSGMIAAIDQVLKWFCQQTMVYGELISVTSFFNWVHFRNTGVAFSLFADNSETQRILLITIVVVISAVLIKLIHNNPHQGESFAYSLILGGAMGNLIDRFFRGYVVDYLDFYWRSWHWPAFNLADIAIVVGVFLFVYFSLCSEKT